MPIPGGKRGINMSYWNMPHTLGTILHAGIPPPYIFLTKLIPHISLLCTVCDREISEVYIFPKTLITQQKGIYTQSE